MRLPPDDQTAAPPGEGTAAKETAMHEPRNGGRSNSHQSEEAEQFRFDAATVESALRMFAPDGDLQLVSIDPFDCPEVRRPPHTLMVRGRWSDAVEWIQRENRVGRNIYWQPNRVRPDLQSKAGKPDITGARFLQVDIDPVEGREFNASAVVERLNGVEVSPSIITFTGGGVQALWRLAETPRV